MTETAGAAGGLANDDEVGSAKRGCRVAHGDVILPMMVLKESALENNLRVMAEYSRRHGCLLAPHGKTTLAPEIFRRQLEHGAWGMTVANVTQARVARQAGADRILVANEVVGAADIEQLAAWLSPGEPTVLCLVDSVAGVDLLERGLSQASEGGALSVLVEIGTEGGRSGAMTDTAVEEVAAAVSSSDRLRLRGVEGYEGVIGSDRRPETLAAVDRYLHRLREWTIRLSQAGAFDDSESVIVTAGGSKYFDRVADVLGDANWPMERPDVVLRSGCYVSHDHGLYGEISPLAAADSWGQRLLPALEVWAEVLSVPESGRAVVGMGKRDVSFDLGFPVALHRVTAGGGVEPAPEGLRIVQLDDQHAYVNVSERALQVGDRLGFGLSHPCTAFDKWRSIALVDDEYTVLDTIRTSF